MKKNEKGHVECPLKCGSHFKTAVNMFKHIDDEVCTKDIEERTNLVCSIKNCNYTCVKKSSLRAHELGHLQVRYYECPVPGCDKAYVQPSSLSNHKHYAHSDIFGDFPKSKKLGETSKGEHTEKAKVKLVKQNPKEKRRKRNTHLMLTDSVVTAVTRIENMRKEKFWLVQS